MIFALCRVKTESWMTEFFIFQTKQWSSLTDPKILCKLSRILLLSHFSHVRLCATPWMAPHQASPSPGFSRQEHWSGLPFPSPVHESEKWKVKSESEVAQSCPTPSDPMDCSPPGSSLHGTFQARVLEWGAIAFSAKWLRQLLSWHSMMWLCEWAKLACSYVDYTEHTNVKWLM